MLRAIGLLSILCLCSDRTVIAGDNDPVNAEFVGAWDGFGGTYADIWGDGDYAYIGHFGHHGVHIIDISDPTAPSSVGEYLLPPPDDNASAQDVKVADGLMFIGIEAGERSVHIVDVRDPLNPLPLTTIDIDGYGSIHNVFYDNGYLYIADSNSTRVGVIDLTQLDPDNPPAGPITDAKWILEDIGSSFVHDITIHNGRLYACAWDSGLWIYDVTDVANNMPAFLGNTPDGGNNTHSSWPTDDGQYVITGEERSGGGVKVYRITDEGDSLSLELTDEFAVPKGDASSVHNQVVVGNRLYNSWYGAGLQVFDINAETGLLEFVASYDGPGSVWGVYPFLGSDRVLLSSMSQGLIIVSVDPSSADLNDDGSIDAADLAILLGSWGPCPDPPTTCPADLDGDGIVGAADLAILLGAWD